MTVPVAAADPVCGHPDFWLADVVLRLARDDERREWDQLMDTQHYLGFRQFAGRGLRYVAEWHGRWLALLGWQTGVFQCAPRDKWIGWDKGVQMPRLHLCANNTRFLILPAAAGVKNLGSYVLGANLRRLSADWERNWGHPLLLAEAFVEMRRYKGSVYLAANWIPVGVTKGYARSNGKYTNKHGVKKKMLVYPLQAGARELLRDPQERAEWNCEAVRVQYSQAELAALDLQAPDLEAVRLRFRHARQALRVTHRTKTSKHGEVTEEVLYAITSLPRAQAGARRLLTLHRGHWRVENSNHYSRDTTFREDASRMRTGHAPANNAALNNLALAIVVLRREPGETVPETLTRLTVRRERALEVILSPH